MTEHQKKVAQVLQEFCDTMRGGFIHFTFNSWMGDNSGFIVGIQVKKEYTFFLIRHRATTEADTPQGLIFTDFTGSPDQIYEALSSVLLEKAFALINPNAPIPAYRQEWVRAQVAARHAESLATEPTPSPLPIERVHEMLEAAGIPLERLATEPMRTHLIAICGVHNALLKARERVIAIGVDTPKEEEEL